MNSKHPAFGILSGFIALCLVLAFVVIHRQNDLQLFSLITAVAFLLAGMLRSASAPQNPLLNVLLIGLGGVLPVYAMRVTGMAFTEQGYVPLFFAFSLCLSVAGVVASRLFLGGWPKTALLLTLFSLMATTLVIAVAIRP
jgi:hypothetical protein